MTEWNLSEKGMRPRPNSTTQWRPYYDEEDVKEFIRRLMAWIEITEHMKEAGDYEHYVHKAHLKRKIRQLAGEKLC